MQWPSELDRAEPAIFEIPEYAKDFLRTHIRAVWELELLFLLRKETHREWTEQEVARALYIDTSSAGKALDRLSRSGIVSVNQARPRQAEGASSSASEAKTYSFNPARTDHIVAELDKLYRENRVSIIRFVFRS